jgi:hypothetical protein
MPSYAFSTVAGMDNTPNDQSMRTDAEPISTRSDPALIIGGLSLGANVVQAGLALYDHFGQHEPQPPAPEPPQVILPPGTDRD